MRRSRVGFALLLATIGLVTVGHAPSAQQKQSSTVAGGQPTVIGIRAHLFQNKLGTISDDVLGKPGGLSNTIAGADSANAALIVVEVSGAPGGHAPGTSGRRRTTASSSSHKRAAGSPECSSIPRSAFRS